MPHPAHDRAADTLLRLGFVLFLLGLLVGFAIPLVANPRMGLASHLQGVMNGIFLVALGLVWPRLQLGARSRRLAFGLATYGTFANWSATFLAAIWGAGRSMPMAANGRLGLPMQEAFLDALLYSLSFAMLVLVAMVIWGLRQERLPSEAKRV